MNPDELKALLAALKKRAPADATATKTKRPAGAPSISARQSTLDQFLLRQGKFDPEKTLLGLAAALFPVSHAVQSGAQSALDARDTKRPLAPLGGLALETLGPDELPGGAALTGKLGKALKAVAGESHAPETLTGVAMRHGRSGKVHSIDGFDGGHGAVWANVQAERGPMTWQDREHLYQDGFITSTGRFVKRDEALDIAKAHHQWTGAQRGRLEPSGKPGLMTEAIGTPEASLPAKYAILTAENPAGKSATAAQNAQYNRAFEKHLTKQGFAFDRVKGAYTDDATGNLLHENSYFVHSIEPKDAEQLGRQFGQNGVVTHLGYHNLAENKLHPSSGISLVTEQPYTELRDGRRIRSEIDWEKNNPLASADAVGDSVAVAPAHWHEKHLAAPDAASRFRDVAKDIRAFPDQRRQDMIDALRGEPYMRPDPYRAPAVITRDRWKPTSRGVFDRTPGSELTREPAPLEFAAKAKPKSKGLHPAAERIANDPAVEKRILSDVEKGRDQGGIGWYGLAPVKASVEDIGGPFSFRDINMAGAAGSARTPTHNELANMSLNLFGKANGLTAEETRAEFLQRFPGTMKPTYMGMHRQIFDRGAERGVMGPNTPTDGALKIPHYFHNRMLGANGVPVDAHEMTMMSQATGIPRDDIKAAMKAGGDNYEALTAPYHRVAEKLGLTPDQVQASRWLGGGLQTGLKSQPQGDFMQTLEDGLLFTARQRGKDESPAGLRSLWGDIVKGKDFFLPYSGDGGFPVY